ncbi:class I SAM-dependent methyltransferase [Paenibacillus puerhi]|uniref:class I SAM-dependent methyltransferase n=1 Tax=Paenibacillus puerhi TaxID=2692622 RepID=UPI00135813B2|nr:class I SAM-dependent methyltransferase [Paenibacillus puerhi]
MVQVARMRLNAKELWLEGMRDWNGKLPERMTDDGQEEAFWQGYVEGRGGEQPIALDEYAGPIREELVGLMNPDDTALEIGPGWGNYTFAAASAVKRLVCVDSSRSVLAYLEKEAGRQCLSNMEYIHAKWEEHQLRESYDVVFGVNCFYRMADIDEALIRINDSARRLAVLGLTGGPEKPHYTEIRERLGCRIKFQRRDYIHLLAMLYELGIDANCRMLELERIYWYDTEEELFKSNLRSILDEEYDRRTAEAILRRHVIEQDGRLAYPHRFKAALLYWKPERIIGC